MLSNLPNRDADLTNGYRDPGAPLTISIQTLADGTCLVSIWGEVDLYTAPHLERVLDDATRAGDRDVLVEFSRDSFIDSTGLHVLIRAAQCLKERGRSLRVTTENPHTRSVIETMGLTGKLGFEDSSAGASN
jgi:anti-sigma B factor antagonist